MTIIVGVVNEYPNRHVVIGGDASGSSGTTIQAFEPPKVFRNGPYLMGSAHSLRVRDLLQYVFRPPDPPADGDLRCFLVTEFVDAMRQCLKDAGHLDGDEAPEEFEGSMLLGVHKRLFFIGPDFQVSEPLGGYAAIGGGSDMALPLLAYLARRSANYQGLVVSGADIRVVLECVSQHYTHAREPMTILAIEN